MRKPEAAPKLPAVEKTHVMGSTAVMIPTWHPSLAAQLTVLGILSAKTHLVLSDCPWFPKARQLREVPSADACTSWKAGTQVFSPVMLVDSAAAHAYEIAERASQALGASLWHYFRGDRGVQSLMFHRAC